MIRFLGKRSCSNRERKYGRVCALFLTWVTIIIILGVVVMVNKRMKMLTRKVMGIIVTHQNGDEDRRWFELPSHKVSHKQRCQQ